MKKRVGENQEKRKRVPAKKPNAPGGEQLAGSIGKPIKKRKKGGRHLKPIKNIDKRSKKLLHDPNLWHNFGGGDGNKRLRRKGGVFGGKPHKAKKCKMGAGNRF